MQENQIDLSGTLTIKDRRSATLDGVKNIESFDENYISLDTKQGRVIIEGSGLKIESLSRDNGAIYITGNISGAYYSGEKASRGVFANLFK